MKNAVRWILAGLGLVAIASASSKAEDWPERPTLRLVVPFPAGGGTDVVGRLIAKGLTERLGKSFIIENRGGANGQIGLQAVKQASADGYTFAVTSDTPMTVNPWLYKSMAYEPLKDFVPVAGLVRLPSMLAVHPSLPVHSVAELIALAKSKPGALSYASAGVGNFSHLDMAMFELATGIKLTHVPYKGTGPSAMAMIGGEVQLGFNNVSTLLPHVKAGQLVALAIAEPKRMPELPDVPAIAETVPGFALAPWVGIVAKAGTPQPIIDRLSKEALSLMNDPAFAKQFTDQQLSVMALPPKEFGALIQSDYDRWGKVIQTAGIKLEE